MERDGVLLLQLGTPDSTSTKDVRRYLREFLSDPRVLDMPAPLRWLLLHAVILPFRPRRSAEQYQKIWTAEGSPLTIHTEALRDRLAERLGDTAVVDYGMRYGNPPISAAVDRLLGQGVTRIVLVPLFPQYSSAAFGSALEKALATLGGRITVPAIATTAPFHDHPGFVRAVSEVAKPLLSDFAPDHILFSYHGLPQSQIRRADETGSWCLASEGCCDSVGSRNRFCYRAHCFSTTAAVADHLGLAAGSFSTSFQSRLAGQRWITPYTDKRLAQLYEAGARRIAVLTPSFVADCLETLEEIGIRLRAQWEQTGGDELLLVPCVNDSPVWVKALADMVRSGGSA
jgi:protoporphyrin/coproporphyrin ferrochelatase